MAKKSNFPVTPVFMLAVAAFAFWTYWTQVKGGAERAEKAEQDAAVLPFSNQDITGIEIKIMALGSVVRHFAATRSGDEWSVTKPYKDPGDAMKIGALLSSLSAEKSKSVVVEGDTVDWKSFGLDTPAIEATISAKTASGEKKRELVVGMQKAFDGSVYARFDGTNKVLLMNSMLEAILNKDPREFRDKHFFIGKTTPDFDRIEAAVAGRRFALVREKGTWVAVGDKSGWAIDPDAVKAYIDTLTGLQGNDVWGEDKTDKSALEVRKLTHPGINVTLSSSESKAIYNVQIAALSKTESVAGGMSSQRPLIFSVFKPQIEALTKGLDDFRELRRPFDLKVADVQKIKVSRRLGTSEVSNQAVAKKDGQWTADAAKPGQSVTSTQVDSLLTKLGSMKAMKLMPEGTGAPKREASGAVGVEFLGAKDDLLLRLTIAPTGAADGTALVVSSKVANRVFQISKEQLADLPFELVATRADIKSDSKK